MATLHTLNDIDVDGFPALCLASPQGLTATYVPTAGMICCSLQHRGEELLGQRRGLRYYATHGSTMGIPLLYPWANRLGRMGYDLDGRPVAFPPASPLLHPDANGLPMHGLLAGCPDWHVTARHADANQAVLQAQLDLSARHDVLTLFPFPHELSMHILLEGQTLSIATTVQANREGAVPVAFGYHPYLALPNVPRAEWHIELPVQRRMGLNELSLPTGQSETCDAFSGLLGAQTYDDLFVELAPQPVFRLTGGGRAIALAFGEGYRVAQVYAPETDPVICFEPMTASIDPFDSGQYVRVQAGASFTATFSISVEKTG